VKGIRSSSSHFRFLSLLLLFVAMLRPLGTARTANWFTASPSSVNFGNVIVGGSQSQTLTLTNSGLSSVTISQATTSSSTFKLGALTLPLTLAPGGSASCNVSFTPTSSGTVSASLSIVVTRQRRSRTYTGTATVPLSGAGVALGALVSNPSSLNFGTVQTGTVKQMSQTISNPGSTAITISQISVSGTGFSFSGITPPQTLYPAQSASFNVSFAPTSGGSTSGQLSLASNSTNPNLSVPLSGTGALPGQLSVSPASMSFGNVTVGASGTQTGSLTATNGSVTVSSASVSGSEFAVSGLIFPLTIAAGGSTSFKVTFTPQASGTASGKVSFANSASASPMVESFSGTGLVAAAHSVDLSWNPSTSAVVGYNIYRSSQSGGPYARINSNLNAGTTYTDSNVQAGQTYYYVATSVDGGGLESGFSTQVKAVVPTP
jgi:centrosomal CEP192-like protein/HYDIN/CFA65/VesB family protein/ASPM-SPD-2-Hydin domain-containing protein